MGVYGDFMDLSPNEWLMFKLAGLRATQFRYKPIFSFSKAVGIF
jgi:polysaccharide pyruvyl transferase WcaK-like protein